MNASESETGLGRYGTSAMSDDERVAILADIILEAISSEQTQGRGNVAKDHRQKCGCSNKGID